MEMDGKTSEFIFTWQLENFSLYCLLNKKQLIESPVFRVAQLQNTEWKLMLTFSDDLEGKIVLNLHRSVCNKGPTSVIIRGKLFIAKTNGSEICLEKGDVQFEKKFVYTDALFNTRQFILENSNDFLQNGILTVGYKFFINSALSLPTIVECSARSNLCLKKYTFLLPLKLKFPGIFNNWEYSSVLTHTADTATEYPTFQIGLKYYHQSNDENIISVDIHLAESPVEGFFQCKLLFFNEETINYERQVDYNFRKTVNNQLWVINISNDTFHKNSIFNTTDLKCELIASTGKFTSFLETTKYRKKMCETSNSTCVDESYLQKKLEKMYSEKSLCDFKVVVSGKELPVHKTVLAAVSPVFRAMFESGMAETEKSEVIIKEFSVEVVEKMIDFLYSGTVEDLEWNFSLELYSIADKYQIQKLKTISSCFLESALSVETVPDLLTLADLHKDDHLQKVAQDFIFGNSKAVYRSDAWKQFMKNNLQVASETMYHFCTVLCSC